MTWNDLDHRLVCSVPETAMKVVLKPFPKCVCVCVCVCVPEMNVHAYIYLSILYLSLFDRNTAASTLALQRTHSQKCSTRIFQLWTNAEMRMSPEKPEREETNSRGREREQRDSYKDMRSQTLEKVEWDIWKRESLGQGGNCSCPAMIHWGKFSSVSPSCPTTTLSNPHLPILVTPRLEWLITAILNVPCTFKDYLKVLCWLILWYSCLPRFPSPVTWAWTTLARSSPEPSRGCTCCQNCE